MDPVLQFLLVLSIIIAVAKAAGYASNRLGQPAVLGELLAGLILGPTALDMLHWGVFSDGHLGESISHLAHLGVLLLMFIAGLEVDLEGMQRAGRPAVLAGVLGVITPVVLSVALALPFGFDVPHSLFMGLTMAATSVSISAQTLMELGVLRSPVGIALLGAAVVDDVLVVLLLSLFVALGSGSGGGAMAVLWVLVRMTAFLAAALWFGMRYVPRIAQAVDRLPISEGMMAFVMVVTLVFAWAAEAGGGMAAITGAFLAGLAFSQSPLRPSIESSMHTIAYSWLVPIFFVNIGLEANARALGLSGLPFALALIAIALISKVLGCGLGGRLGGFSNIDALRLGVGMASRGEVGLIVASVGLASGLIDQAVFAAIVLVVLVTTLVTPIALKQLYRGETSPARVAEAG